MSECAYVVVGAVGLMSAKCGDLLVSLSNDYRVSK